MPEIETTAGSFAAFDAEMQSLTSEAERKLYERKPDRPAAASMNFGQFLRPLVLGIEALGRATEENNHKLGRLEAALTSQTELPKSLSTLKESIDHRHSVNQQLFDALHAELKSYKDGFLLEVMQKPIILDLIALYDIMETVHKQATGLVASDIPAENGEPGTCPKTLATNFSHTMHVLLEILARMDVTKLESSKGQRLDKTQHRAVKVELADRSEDDGEICESLKAGFLWKSRILRPEEVTIRKFKEGYLTALPATTQPSQK